VRKGARSSAFSHGPELGGAVRTALPNAAGGCWGALVGYRLELESVTFLARASLCTSSFENQALRARTNEAALSLGAARAWDFTWLSTALSAGGGASLWTQHFETEGRAPDRLSVSPFAYIGARAVRELSLRMLIALEVHAEGHLLHVQDRSTAPAELRLEFAARSFALVGAQF
jgi:hypothetical protein